LLSRYNAYLHGFKAGQLACKEAVIETAEGQPYTGRCRQCYLEEEWLCASLAAAPPEAKRDVRAKGGLPICSDAKVMP